VRPEELAEEPLRHRAAAHVSRANEEDGAGCEALGHNGNSQRAFNRGGNQVWGGIDD